jgi:hypothetical protein
MCVKAKFGFTRVDDSPYTFPKHNRILPLRVGFLHRNRLLPLTMRVKENRAKALFLIRVVVLF